jgi:hypothetical protein
VAARHQRSIVSTTNSRLPLLGLRNARSRGQFHPPRLDLGQVKDVIDERQEVASRLQNGGQVIRLLVVDLAEQSPLGPPRIR